MFKRKIKNLHEIEFSIISKGTERAGSPGYMAVTYCDADKKRKIVPVPHGIIKYFYKGDCLDVREDVGIAKIAFSRFQLITAVMYEKNRKYFNKNDSILVIGSGSVGFTACMELCRQGHKEIYLLSRENKKIRTDIFRDVYGVNLKLTSDMEKVKDLEYIIDATGNSEVLREVIGLCSPFSTIFILGTPRKNTAIDSLMVHRKSIRLIGGHELIGLTNKERNYIFNEILKENEKHSEYLYEQLAIIEDYSKGNREKLLKTNNHIVNIMRYDK